MTNRKARARKTEPSFSREVGAKAARKLKARRNSTQGVWFGLGMMGLIGWSVVVPTLLGAALGTLAGQALSGQAFLDAGAAGRRPRHRLFECLALGGQGRQGHARANRRITMNETLGLALALVAGVLLGAFFFGGLWWTVRKGVSSERPALWFFGSLLLRMSVDPGWILLCFGRSLGAAAAVSPWICPGTPGRDVADPAVGRKPNPPGTGGQPCALVPTR